MKMKRNNKKKKKKKKMEKTSNFTKIVNHQHSDSGQPPKLL